MKRATFYLKIVALACVTVWVSTSCGEKEEESAPELTYLIDGSSPATLSVLSGEVTKTVSVTSNGAWNITVSAGSPAWIQASPDRSDRSGSFTLTVQANTSTESRAGTLTFVMEKKTVATLTVAQSGFGAELEAIPATPEQAAATGGSLEFAVAANTDWTYSLSAGADAWLREASKTAGALTLTADPNTATEERNATVTFSLTGYPAVTKAVTVSQAAFAPALELTPATPEQAAAAGGSLEFAVAANAEWTYSLSAGADAWLREASKTAGALTLTVEPNTATEERNATVTFSLVNYPAVTQAVEVSQAGVNAELDKTLWREFKLPSDFQNTLPGDYAFPGMFDNVICPWNGWSNVFIPDISSLPSTFTLDLGVEARLSRINIVPWWTSIYMDYPKEFEVYGTASHNPGDDLAGGDWTLIGKFKSWKPSGDDPLVITAEDQNYAWPGGENFDVKPSEEQPDPYFPVRMVRFRIMDICQWNGGILYAIDELSIWGEIVK